MPPGLSHDFADLGDALERNERAVMEVPALVRFALNAPSLSQ